MTAPTIESCAGITSFAGIAYIPCEEPAIGRFSRICVHEHVRLMPLCSSHAEMPTTAICRTCQELPDDLSHQCPIDLVAVPS